MQLLHDTQLVHVDPAGFWKMQLLMCVGALWVWMPRLLALFFSPKLRPYRVVGWVAVLGMGLQAALHGKAYYALGYYPVLFGFGAWWWEARLAGRRWSRVAAGLRPGLVALPLLLLASLFPFLFPVRPLAAMVALRTRYASLGFYTWEDGRQHALPQDYADMRGWRELAQWEKQG